MEDMARLAFLEEKTNDEKLLASVLLELLYTIGEIVDSPSNTKCKVVPSEVLTQALKNEGCLEYFEYLGFKVVENNLKFPEDVSIIQKLKTSAIAIEKKLSYSCGITILTTRTVVDLNDKTNLNSVYVIPTRNRIPFRLEENFNIMLKYEDRELLQLARSKVQILDIYYKAFERMKVHKKKIINGEIKGPELSFERAQLMELIGWFKYKFFSWVDKPKCEFCSADTQLFANSQQNMEGENCRVEIYKCNASCVAKTLFPRYNNPRRLLDTRRGRCGEWANAFTLICRAFDYDVRIVHDNADHVWCEVYDFHANRWLHVDPCEAALDTPLVYEHGWKKDITYVFAFSRDDLQDVTWRYTSKHKEVLSRRKECTELQLLDVITKLRERRQRNMSSARRNYLAKRCLLELAEFMTERQPSSYESHGRISGAESWRRDRGELGHSPHIFKFDKKGVYTIRYYPAKDLYNVEKDGEMCSSVNGWCKGAFIVDKMFRKEESDWEMVYLVRTEDSNEGTIGWKLTTDSDHKMNNLSMCAVTKVFQTGRVNWTLKFDDNEPIAVSLNESKTSFPNTFTSLIITAKLSGGEGDVSWQHAQLFRQSIHCHDTALDISLHVT